MKLFLYPKTQELKEFYIDRINNQSKFDSGFDLVIPEDIKIPALELGFKIDLKVSSFPLEQHGYYLHPRSSMGTKTPLRMSNSAGIIDCGYTGNIIMPVDNLGEDDYIIKKNTRLCQLVAPDMKKIDITVVDHFDSPDLIEILNNRNGRGSGGFGSTGV